MHIVSAKSDMFSVDVDKDDLGTIGNCLNEILNGVSSDAHAQRLGITRNDAQVLHDAIVNAYRSGEVEQKRIAVDHALERKVQIARLDNDKFEMSLARPFLEAIRNCIRESRGAIRDWEFPIRLGASTAEADALAQTIDAALSSSL